MAKRTIPHQSQVILPFADYEKFCLQCGRIFRKQVSDSKAYWPNKKFCSRRCGVIWHSATSVPRMIQARAGKPVWNAGKKMSEQHCKKLSLMRKGKPFSFERRERMHGRIRQIRGEDWQPNHAHSIKDSLFYRNWRRLVFERDGFRCVLCGYQSCKRINGRSDIQADHIKPYSVIIQEHSIQTFEQAVECKELWDVANGRTLCQPCHKKTPTYGRNALYQPYTGL